MLSESSAVPMLVKKTCAKQRLSDEDFWGWTDTKIIGKCAGLVYNVLHLFYHTAKSQKTWKSAVYSHYNVSLMRCQEMRMLAF